MNKTKFQLCTSMKYKILDLVAYLTISFVSIGALYLLMPKKPDLIQVILLLLILIPTIVALIGGAPFVPTPMRGADKVLKTAGVKKGETVIDIGCGDGRFCYLAANKFGAKAIGVELSPFVYLWAKIRQLLWRSKAKIKFGDFRMLNLSEADHIVAYMLPETLIKFIPKFEKELKKGTKITSYAFKIGDWVPIHLEPADKEQNLSKIWVYEIGKQYAK
ncbi:SAM-dependent methyltransferase [Patescibacteria group bacterium]